MVLLTDEEITLLLNDLIEVYGYDFSGYSRPMLQRRITRLFRLRSFSSFEAFRRIICSNPEFLNWFIAEVTVPVTEMFRDPDFFRALREEVLPVLRSLPLIRIWHAGCSTGEEVYSMAIMLKEMDLLHKSILYATDINTEVLQIAATGIFQLSGMKKYSENYILSGGIQSLSNYYTAHYEFVKVDEQLKKRIVFSTHNLAADTSFNYFHLIICRNVLIYFNQDLQNRVVGLFDASLESQGFLALGSKETLRFTSIHPLYHKFNPKEKIWRKNLTV